VPENDAFPHLTSNSSLIIQLDGAPVHFAYIACECLDVNFPGQWIRIEESVTWPPFILLILCLDFILCGYVNDSCTAKE
jgi:hypothetical protein